MDLTPNPRLRLLLHSSVRNGELASTAVVWSPANKLQGILEITSETSFNIDEAAIFLEGISRNWIANVVGNEIALNIVKAERNFLSQTLDISLTTVDLLTPTPEGFRLAVPFHFIIANTISGFTSGPPLQCLRLPPSIELGNVYVDEPTGRRFAQPSISYHLRVVVKFAEQGQDPTYTAETSIPIVIMPQTEELPPTDTKDFPAEFNLQESKNIRWSSLGRTLGTMTISTQEPRALTYDLSSTGASTEGFLNLEVRAKSTCNIRPSLQAMSFTVLSLLRVKTFYSTKAFPRLPSQSLLTSYGDTRLRDDIIKLETQNKGTLLWGYIYDAIEDETIGRATQFDVQSLQSASNLNSQPPQGKWNAKINYPIHIDSRLLPTFCSAIVARFYSIILRVKVSGIKNESFDLEVPLQVVHTAPGVVSNEAAQYVGITGGPFREDSSLLEFRRASATSWFSDESLESEESPPRYYH